MLTKGDLRKIGELIDGKIEKLAVMIHEGFLSVEERMGRLEQRMDVLEQRMDTLEQRMDALGQRMTLLEAKVGRIDSELQEVKERLGRLEEKIDRQWRGFNQDLIDERKSIENIKKRVVKLEGRRLALRTA